MRAVDREGRRVAILRPIYVEQPSSAAGFRCGESARLWHELRRAESELERSIFASPAVPLGIDVRPWPVQRVPAGGSLVHHGVWELLQLWNVGDEEPRRADWSV